MDLSHGTSFDASGNSAPSWPASDYTRRQSALWPYTVTKPRSSRSVQRDQFIDQFIAIKSLRSVHHDQFIAISLLQSVYCDQFTAIISLRSERNQLMHSVQRDQFLVINSLRSVHCNQLNAINSSRSERYQFVAICATRSVHWHHFAQFIAIRLFNAISS